ncbi:hypothetical protein GCM10022243_21840 [Saccharothrix violaceirubra]|uniref:MlaB-like STAS domain-containing protein n=1 Tax=Saccharothrix violaceirubra TaxID=413306 RepID=A0A7W7T1L8_9PSEU|nr:STAS domain-containing protein [Saccharothrix violaceirubra]MBB4964883.1 hypothetical protein [Saccharothrix violaceirubra]
MVITREGDPPGIVLSGAIDPDDLAELRALLLADGCGDVRLDLRAVPFLVVGTLRVLVQTAVELHESGRDLVLDLAPQHEWTIGAVGWSAAPGLVLANGTVPR